MTGEAPARALFAYALLLDEHGEEMHKSKGNAIPFDEAADRIGADVMRWMFAAANPAVNLRLRLRAGATRSCAASSCRSGTPTASSSPTPASTAGRPTRPTAPMAHGRCSTAGSCRASTHWWSTTRAVA